MTIVLVKSSVALGVAVFLTAAPVQAQSTNEIGAADTTVVAAAGPVEGAAIDPPAAASATAACAAGADIRWQTSA